MHRITLKNNVLAVVAAVLAMMVLLTGILVCDLLIEIQDNTPSTEFCIELNRNAKFSAAPVSGPVMLCAQPVMLSSIPAAQSAAPVTLSSRSSATVYDEDQVWSKETRIALFHASYENTTGEITVQSAYGDKVIAPGTANSYYFYIRNNGNTPIDYTVETQAELTAAVDGQTYVLPLTARFYNTDGEYFVGSGSAYEDMGQLDGVQDTGSLSVNHYTRYTLDWQWPFEGDDTLDTLLGNLAAAGDAITVTVTIHVTATGNDNASGGIPKTGDSSHIGLWVTVMITSMLLLIFLLFKRRKDENEKAHA